MSDSYIELLIKRKTSPAKMVIKIVLAVVAAVCLFFGLTGYLTFFLIGIILGLAAYYAHLGSCVEYEYLYLNKELSVDRILAKSKRKRMAEFDLQRMEVLAPANSHRLDSYNNKKYVTYDFASNEEDSKQYILIYAGDNEVAKVKLDLTDELYKAIHDISPRKVFAD